MTNQEDLKRMAALRAVDYVPEGEFIGIGTGSTVQYFIEALAASDKEIKGAVSTSKRTSKALHQFDIPEVRLNDVNGLFMYIDGADEINHLLQMIKGGGGALLNEKIVASASECFVCIASEKKYVNRLGRFPLAVEVIPEARSLVSRQLVKLGGEPELRLGFTTDNGNQIVDVSHLTINEPIKMEDAINAIPGVVDNGLFAHRPADLLILARKNGVEILRAEV